MVSSRHDISSLRPLSQVHRRSRIGKEGAGGADHHEGFHGNGGAVMKNSNGVQQYIYREKTDMAQI